MDLPGKCAFDTISEGFHVDPSRSLSLRKEAYVDPS